MEDDYEGDENPHPLTPLVIPVGLALSDSEKAEALVDSLEAKFQTVNDPSLPAVIEVVNEGMRAYLFVPASEPGFTNPKEVQDAIRGLKVGKAPCPDGITNRALKHLPLSVFSLLVVLFNAIFRSQYYPPSWKHARVFDFETWKEPGAAHVLPTHKSARHAWHTV